LNTALQARSRRNLQLPWFKQQKTREVPFFSVTVIADDDDSRSAINHRRAHPFCVPKTLQAGDRDTARWRTGLAAPEPELEFTLA